VRQAVLDGLEHGHTLRAVCRGIGMPEPSTVLKWIKEDPEGFGKQYARAREIGYETMADDLVDMVRNTEPQPGEVQRARLEMDTVKWLLSKALPKIYGDKLQHTGAGGDEPISITVKQYVAPKE
jgi:transposase-like protein